MNEWWIIDGRKLTIEMTYCYTINPKDVTKHGIEFNEKQYSQELQSPRALIQMIEDGSEMIHGF
jgi:hypothetical protein